MVAVTPCAENESNVGVPNIFDVFKFCRFSNCVSSGFELPNNVACGSQPCAAKAARIGMTIRSIEIRESKMPRTFPLSK